MLDPSYRLECLRLACAQATVSPLYFSDPESPAKLADGERWSFAAAEEILCLAQKYADFIEGDIQKPVTA